MTSMAAASKIPSEFHIILDCPSGAGNVLRGLAISIVTTRSPLSRRAILLLFCSSMVVHAHIDTLLPPQVTTGGPAFTLRVFGSDLEPDERLLWNATALVTTYVSAGEIRAVVPAELIRNPGSVVITLAGFNSLTFVVNPALQITSTSPLPDAPANAAYTHRLLSTGGTAPLEWQVSAGALPAGLTLARTTGVISGTATGSGVSTFTVRVTDAVQNMVSKPFSLTVGGTGGGAPSCVVSPQNSFLPIHAPENHAPGRNAYPDHTVRVVTSLPGLPVSIAATRPIFAGNPLQTMATATTDGTGTAVFVVNPPAATASDRTDLTVTGSRGTETFTCSGSIVVGIGTMTALARGLSGPNTAALARLRRQLDADDQRFVMELETIIRRSEDLTLGAEAALSRFYPVLTAALEGQAVRLKPGELRAVDRLTRAIEADASPDLRRTIRRWRADMFTLAGRVEPPAGKMEWRRMKAAEPLAARAALARRTVSFEAGGDQGFLLRGAAHSALLSREGVALLSAQSGLVRMRLDGRRRWPRPAGVDPLAVRSHYIGRAGRTDVPHFARVRYPGVYPGTDLVFYGDNGELRYDFVLRPGAQLERVVIAFDGVQAIEPEDNGELVLHHTGGSTRLGAPAVYQDCGSERRFLASHYVQRSNGAIGFSVDGYDRSLPLVIDPVVVYAGFAGGAQDDAGLAIAVDGQGSAYVAGFTASAGLPGTGNIQAFVTKFTPDGSGVVYTTYFGGDGMDVATSLAVDGAGNVFVGGSTTSANFPVVRPVQGGYAGGSVETGGDGFVVKLDRGGAQMMYSTYLGGSRGDAVRGLAVDGSGNAYVTGFTASENFPVRSALQPAIRGGVTSRTDAFVAKLNAAGDGLVYSTFLGGTRDDLGLGLAVDGMGNAYVTGITYSGDFPVRDALQGRNAGSADAFVAKVNAVGSALVYSTYLGGESDDFGLAIAVDAAGAAHVTGATGSGAFPLVNAAQAKFGAADRLGFDAFVSKLNPAGGALVYSTYLGGSGVDVGHAIALGADGGAVIAGETDSSDFPMRNAVRGGGAANDGFVARLSANGASFEYASLLGGQALDSAAAVAVDGAGNVYVAGTTTSRDHPATPGAAQTLLGGRADAFALKITPGVTPPLLTVVSAAALARGGAVAPDSIASAFGTGLSPRTEVAPGAALPLELACVSLQLRDSRGTRFAPGLYFVSAGQVNFVVPAGAASGLAELTVQSGGLTRAAGTLRIEAAAPALFTANANGGGPPAAVGIRVAASGEQTTVPLFSCGTQTGSCVAAELSVADPTYLTLYGTGIRGRTSLGAVRLTIGGVAVPVAYAGAQSEYSGFDQVNAGPVPVELAGRGAVEMVLTVDERMANAVALRIR